jgi:uncharacterized UBP type Zn finger protein
MPKHCSHLAQVRTDQPNTDGCEECLKMGDSWVHLRLCRTCGHVGCCDDSKNKHATKHFHATTHPIITSIEPGEDWSWCYVDQLAMQLSDAS